MDPMMIALLDESLSVEDLLLLFQMKENKEKKSFEGPFVLEDLTEEEILLNFRFKYEDLLKLKEVLRIPESIICESRVKCSGIEGLCILLRRLAYPNRLCDLSNIFGRSECQLSQLFNETLNHVHTNYVHLLSDLHQDWIINSLADFSASVNAKGAPLMNCWGFLDGTLRPICRPSYNQRLVYNGHKRVHGLKFQSIMTPNGLIANMSGPYEGRRHDSFILAESNIVEELQNLGNFVIYGDPAYALRFPIICPFHTGNISPEQENFNKEMSKVRQCVEWGFGKMLQYFSFLDYKKNQKLYLQPVGKYYLVSAILINAHTCLYGSQTSTYFGMEPPTLDEYFQFQR